MKKTGKIVALTPFILIVGVTGITLTILLLLRGIDSIFAIQEWNCYRHEDRFITEILTVEDIAFEESEPDEIYLYLLPEAQSGFYSEEFYLKNNRARTALENGLLDDLSIGDHVSITAAPYYLGDGYTIPIVEIAKDGKVYLTYDEGYPMLMREIRSRIFLGLPLTE